MQVGFIGLGNLGTPIAENLLATHQLFVYNRTAAKAQPLVESGAILCTSVKELATMCDVVFSIVSDDAALKNITEGPDGIAAHLKRGGVHVSMSTILPATATALEALHHQHHNYYISSPILGRPEVARARKLNMLVSGNAEEADRIKPLLSDAGGAAIWEFGEEAAAAPVAKLCSNYLILSGVAAMAEGIHLAKQSGIDAAQWMNMLTQTIFSAPIYINYSAVLLKENYLPAGFGLKLALKDANLVLQQSAATGSNMPVGKTVQELLEQAVAAGFGEHDVTAVAEVVKK
jgi:3-hydroxyisobutyrate dehydrogenase-like beta-hydroxyacid dehydrogenase